MKGRIQTTETAFVFVFVFVKRYNKLISLIKFCMSSKTVYFISFAIFALGLLLGIAITYSYFTVISKNVGGSIACSMEAKLCSDGSTVRRTGPNCEFAECGSGGNGIVGSGNILPADVGEDGSTSGGGGVVACAMDAKLCPDGSSVGRIGPNCEFEACPISTADSVSGKSCRTASDCGTGYECVDMSPVVREGVPVNLYCSKVGAPRPICLSGDTYIETPAGDVAVKNMKEGMSVWTIDKNGKKVFGTVILAGKTRVPSTHKVMHIKLSDNRELLVSPGHKIADGRTAGQIIFGDIIDNTLVTLADLVPYTEEYTYDILPSGETGMYYANGILLQSTLK